MRFWVKWYLPEYEVPPRKRNCTCVLSRPKTTLWKPESPGPARESSTQQHLQQHLSRKEIRGSHAPDLCDAQIVFLVKPLALLEEIHDVGLRTLVVDLPESKRSLPVCLMENWPFFWRSWRSSMWSRVLLRPSRMELTLVIVFASCIQRGTTWSLLRAPEQGVTSVESPAS